MTDTAPLREAIADALPHRPFRVDEWLLYSFDSPTAQGGRGLARGQIFSRDGQLVASTAQEGLIRLRG